MIKFLLLLVAAVIILGVIFSISTHSSSPRLGYIPQKQSGGPYLPKIITEHNSPTNTNPDKSEYTANPTQVGYKVAVSDQGLTVYQKGDSYLVWADLQSSHISFLHGKIIGNPTTGIWGEPDQYVRSLALDRYFPSSKHRLVCVSSGMFFKLVESPTRLAHPLKTDNQVVTYGWESDTVAHPGEKMMLSVDQDTVDISPLTQEGFLDPQFPNVLTGLTSTANKKPKDQTNRLFLGTITGHELLLLFARNSTQAQAEKEILKLGAIKIMMLDGGGTTQLSCKHLGTTFSYFESQRLIPQAILMTSD